MKRTSTALVLSLAVTAAACSSTSSTSPIAPTTVSQAGALGDSPSAGGQNGRAGLPTIAGIAVSNPNFSTLVAALSRAGLVDLVNGSRQFTVFAPTNDAFDKAAVALLGEGKTGMDLVNGLPLETLTAVLTYHVTEGSRISTGLVRSGQVKMLDGNVAQITSGPDGAMIGGAKITAVDIRASNGIIHVIDFVLLPPAE